MKAVHNRILITLVTVAVVFNALAWKQEDVNEFSRLMKEGQELAKAGKYEEAIAKGKAARWSVAALLPRNRSGRRSARGRRRFWSG